MSTDHERTPETTPDGEPMTATGEPQPVSEHADPDAPQVPTGEEEPEQDPTRFLPDGTSTEGPAPLP